MNKIKSALFVSLLSTLCALNTAHADPSIQDKKPQQEHIQFNTRPLSEKEMSLMEQKRSLEEEQASQGLIQKSLFRPTKHTKECRLIDYIAPIASHWIAGFVDARTIQLEDGSEWQVHLNDSRKILSWRAQDWVSISPNSGFFASSPYYLTNETAGTYVRVTPFMGPKAFGVYTFWVVGTDFISGNVNVINGLGERSTWRVASSDLYLFDKWAINDTVILGIDNSFSDRFWGYDHILINVPMNHYIRVKQL